jgi:predicted TIM-barrel fold metal-dependent hydrolase
MTARGRIDTHQHVVPPEYRDLLDRAWSNPGSIPVPEWSAAHAIDIMGQNGIATGILSISVPGVNFGDVERARTWARTVNELTADLVRDRPSSFGMFACLTLPVVDGSLAEAEYALDVLRADGIVLLADHDGIYLGDPSFAPLFAELGRRGAVVFVHPNDLPTPPIPGVPPFAADFLLDTTRSAFQLVTSGTLASYPDLKIILSHAGGFVPYVADRVAPLLGRGDATAGRELLRRFYFDVAVSSGPSALPSLLGFADPTRITYGSDSPYAPDPVVAGFRAAYEKFELDPDLRYAIDRGNAEALFPRLAALASTG